MALKIISKILVFLLLHIIGEISSLTSNENDIPIYLRIAKGNMMESAPPCTDFYSYSCGNWKKNLKIPRALRDYSVTKYSESMLDKLISDFTKNQTSQGLAEQKVKQFYASCMNMRNQFHQTFETIEKFIKENAPNENETQLNWIELNFAFDKWGINPFVKYEMNYAKKEISIKYPTNSEWFSKIVEMMTAFLNQRDAEKQLLFRNLPELQKLHANLTLLGKNSEQAENIKFEKLNLDSLKNGINWHKLFNEIFNKTVDDLSEWKIYYHLGNNSNEYNNLLSMTDQKILLNYVIFNVLSDYVNMIINDIYKPLDKVCIKNIKKYFPTAILPHLIEKTFADDWKTHAMKTFEQIKTAFLEYFDRVVWMDHITSALVNKLNEIKIMIGDFTDEDKNRTKQDELFQSINITNNYGENLLNLRRKEVADLKFSDRQKLSFSWPTYINDSNTISIPLLYTQTPFYNRNYSDLMKFGGMSFVIAYEMVENVIFKYRNLWSESSIESFDKTFEFLQEKLNDLVESGKISNNGTEIMQMLIADHIAAQIAHDSFKANLKMNLTYSEPLEYFNLDADHFYLMQMAQGMCSGEKHDLGPIRVNTFTHNLPEFAEVYGCRRE